MPDVEGVRALANTVAERASQTRAEAARLRGAASVQFVSKAADRYRTDLREQADAAERAAQQIDEAARALRHHADEVEHRLAQIASIERLFSGLVSDARHELSEAADGVGDAAKSLLNAAANAPLPGSPHWPDFARPFGL